MQKFHLVVFNRLICHVIKRGDVCDVHEMVESDDLRLGPRSYFYGVDSVGADLNTLVAHNSSLKRWLPKLNITKIVFQPMAPFSLVLASSTLF